MREIYVQYACNIRAICIKNYCILHTKSTDEAAYFAFKFSSICTKNLPNMHAKFDLKCINFKCILQSRKTVGSIDLGNKQIHRITVVVISNRKAKSWKNCPRSGMHA